MLSVRGDAVVGAVPTIDPDSVGFRVRVAAASGRVIADLSVPAGALDSTLHRGWTEKTPGELWQYGCNGEVSIKISQDPVGSGEVRFRLKAKKRAITLLTSDLPLTLTAVVDAPIAESNQCAETAFPIDACGPNASGTTISCR